MSTKKEMLGKENRKENGHRRYSLLLLALLFIGFATYGTYAYFTSSTSTTRGKLTLNGLDSSYNVDKDDIDNQNTGDGTSNPDNNDKYVPGKDGDGEFKPVPADEATNSTKFGEFPWVYVGNDVKAASSENPYDNLFTHSFDLTNYNGYITSNEDNTVFDNVVEGDVFRKTVRLAVKGTSKVPVTAQLTWNGVNDEDKDNIDNIIAAAYVRVDDQVDDQTDEKKAQPFDKTDFTELIRITSTKHTEKINKPVKAGQYIDVELVAAVKGGTGTTKGETVAQLAKIARQLSIHLEQQTDDVIKTKTQTVENK
ncbi:hypothetical protein [Enterococcus cecorum]|uniref:hypothetical protein n=1 Tax=Enterococcus cecorum TaxID=44008 RepID=UPI000B3A938F|nr:hypothetical protein [Enterococcus cecorum]OUN49137.1 hypothetical protein B5G19_07625 [Enterococcus cecorum]